MRIINGRWVDDNEDTINDFNVSKFLDIRNSVVELYSKDITYDKISIVSSIKKLSDSQENMIASLLTNNDFMNRLIKY